MNDASDHTEVDSDDDQIRYELNTDPLSTKEMSQSDCRDGETIPETHGRIEKPLVVNSQRRRRLGGVQTPQSVDRETNPKWIFPGRREEASESEDNEEFHDSVQGDQQDVEGEDCTGDPERRRCELGDYRDARAAERSRERRRGPCDKSVDGSKGQQRQQPAGGDADPSFFTSASTFVGFHVYLFL